MPTVEEAALADLPEILAAPPWLKKKKKAPSRSWALEPLPCEDIDPIPAAERAKKRMHQAAGLDHFKDDPRDIIKVYFPLKRNRPLEGRYLACFEAIERNDVETTVELWRDLCVEHKAKAAGKIFGLTLNLQALDCLPFELSLPIWNATSDLYDYLMCEEHMVEAYGAAAKPGLMRVFEKDPSGWMDLAGQFGFAEMAPVFARLYGGRGRQGVQAARQWFARYPRPAIIGLLPPALGAEAGPRRAARSALMFLASSARDLILETAGQYHDDQVTQAVQEMLNADPLDNYPAKISPLPAFWAPESWTRPILKKGPGQGRALPLEAVDHLGRMLSFTNVDGHYQGLEIVRDWCDEKSLAGFAWDLFRAWESGTKALGDRFAFTALGPLADETIPRRLVPYISGWPFKSLKARSLLALDILEEMNSEAAWKALNTLSFKRNLKGVQAAALEKLESIAANNGQSLDSLRDRLTPTLDLDQHSGLTLDFGPRQFRVNFDKRLKPLIRDDQGKIFKSLPRASAADDPQKARAAAEIYAGLKKEAETVAAQQSRAFQQAMIRKRFWDRDIFESCLATHPLIRFLVQALVWGVYEDEGGPMVLKRTFRVDENFSYSDRHDEPLTLDGPGCVGLPHPLEMQEEERADWRQVLADYELIQPLAQLDREIFRLSAEEAGRDTLKRGAGRSVPTKKLQTLVWRTVNSWQTEPDYFASHFYQDLNLSGDGRTLQAVLSFAPGIDIGYGAGQDEQQTLESLTLNGHGRFSEVDPILMSEILRDLELM